MSKETNKTQQKVFFQPMLSGSELPFGLFSFQVFVNRNDLDRWMKLHGYNKEDYEVANYGKGDIENPVIIDGSGNWNFKG